MFRLKRMNLNGIIFASEFRNGRESVFRFRGVPDSRYSSCIRGWVTRERDAVPILIVDELNIEKFGNPTPNLLGI